MDKLHIYGSNQIMKFYFFFEFFVLEFYNFDKKRNIVLRLNFEMLRKISEGQNYEKFRRIKTSINNPYFNMFLVIRSTNFNIYF
jgi:hypothetical protein